MIPDNDPAGRADAKKVLASLAAAGVPGRLLQLPGLPQNGDVSDWLAAGGTREKLLSLAAAQDPVCGSTPYRERTANRTPDETPVQPPPFAAPVPISALQATDEGALWLWHGFLSRGGVTLLSALWKAGKTTLLAHLLRALETAGTFCGLPVAAARALRQRGARIALGRAPRRLGIADHVEMLVRPFRTKPTTESWLGFLDHVVTACALRKYDLLVFDTISNLWPVRDENDAARVQEALMPLRAVSDVMSVLLVHHLRKSDGPEATASRGSGALPAFADTLMELRRYAPSEPPTAGGCSRATGGGATPDEVVVCLAEDAQGYSVQGDRADASFADLQRTIADLLPGEAPGWTREELVAEWPAEVAPGKKRLLDALRKAELGLWHVEGAGRKGSPFTYWRFPATPFEEETT